jgi:adenosylhomocysteine nucleosidase
MPVYQAICEEYNPKLVVLLGIGGSLDDKLEICDVVVGNTILNYDMRAETKEGVEHTFDPLPPIEPWLKQLYQKLERKYGEDISLPSCPGSLTETFKVKIGPIGSGSAVIKDEDSKIREWLTTVSRKSKAVETEAVGVAQQFQSDKLKNTVDTKGYLVIRGISDNADKDKDKEFRYHPAMNAMLFLKELVSEAEKGF